MMQIAYWKATNVRQHRTKTCRSEDLASRFVQPCVLSYMAP